MQRIMTELGKRYVICNKVLDYLAHGQRSKAIRVMYEVMDKFGDFGLRERLDAARDDYNRMVEYWNYGVKDPDFDDVSERNKRIIADIVSEYTARAMNTEDSCYLLTLDKLANKKHDSWNWDEVKNKLESLMSEEAVAGLDFVGEGKERLYRLVDEHYEYQKRLFYHTVCLGLLKHDDAELIKQLLASPTVDISDLQVIVTALSLSGCRAFDIRKFDIMAYACRHGADMKVRQRALVGVMLTMGHNMYKLYPEQKDILDDLLADEGICSQLTELQMQLIYCVKAIDDSKIMDKEILPNVIKSSQFRVTKDGFQEIEEDPMDDILGKNTAEKRAEETEQLLGRLKEMHDAGSDLFFYGFSKMKSGPFFDEMVNWFIPYNPMHKYVRGIIDYAEGMTWIDKLTANTAMCDSDRFSLVFVLGEMVKRMPKSMFDSLKSFDNFNLVDTPEDNTPSLYRRHYLQSLFRFFKLFKWSNGLISPFEDYYDSCISDIGYKPTYLFVIVGNIFEGTDWYNREQPRLTLFMSNNLSDQLIHDLKYIHLEPVDSYEGAMAMVKLKMKSGNTDQCISSLYKALRFKPDSLIAKKMLAKALVDINPQESVSLLLDVGEVEKDTPQTLYTFSRAFFNVQLYEKAITTLYELEYRFPDNLRVKNLLGSILFILNDVEKAYHMLKKGVEGEDDSQISQYALILSSWITKHSAEEIKHLAKKYKISLQGLYQSENKKHKDRILKVVADNGIGMEELDMLVDLSEEWSE